MAPRRLVNRQQLDTMLDFLEQNKDVMLRGQPGPGTLMPGDINAARTKWCVLSRILNAIESGHKHTPIGWRKYWTAYGHKIKMKAENCRQIENGQSNDKYIPLTEVELRVLSILPGNVPKINNRPSSPSGIRTSPVRIRPTNMDEGDTKPLVYVIKAGPKPINKTRQSERRRTVESTSAISAEYFAEDNQEEMGDRPITPPPQWALDIEERRTQAQERTAAALETIAALLTTQEERQAVFDERISNTLTSISGTVQELNIRIQETLQHLNPIQLDASGPDIKDHSYI